MNALEKFIQQVFDGDEKACMDALQDNGIISDNSVRASDLSDSDAEKAVEWLKSVA